MWLGLLSILVFFTLRAFSYAQPWYFDYSLYRGKYERLLAGQMASMSDSELYAWAGWQYVHGLSPEQLNFEHPPLAKYLIGLSITIFGSHLALSIILGVATLLIIFLISKKVLPAHYALMAPLFLATDNLFLQFFATSMLDVYSTFFVTLYVLLFLLFRHAKWSWVPLGFVLGLSLASKWLGLFALPALALFAFIQKDRKALLSLLMSLSIAALTYTGAYAVYFLNGHSLQDFIGLQIDIWKFQSNLRFGRGTPPPFWLMFNFITGIEGPATWSHIYVNWTAHSLQTTSIQYGLSTTAFYNPLTWPLSFAASIFALIYGWRHDTRVLSSSFVFLSFVAGTSYGQIFLWYLLPALPFAFICLAYMMTCLKSTIRSRKRGIILIVVYCLAVAMWSLFFQLPSFITTV